jgi:hypothetical protein
MNKINYIIHICSMLGGSLVTTAWHILRLQMERRLPDMESSCEYIEYAVADSQQGVVLQVGSWVWG